MSVLLTLMAVTKSVPTPTGHLSVAATVVSLSPMMEGLAWRIMNVPLEHITVNRSVSTPMEDLNVTATQDLN